VLAAAVPPASSPPALTPAEATEIHTRILRVSLATEEARSYWEHADLAVPLPQRAVTAFERRWFGGKSLDRVRFLIATFRERFDAFPEALPALRRLAFADSLTRQLICHFHVQLSDPIYRRFTGEFLVKRRSLRNLAVDRDGALRWLREEYPQRWSVATEVQFASKLLSTASEAGLVTAKKNPRTVLVTKVPDLALAYVLHSLRAIRFEGTILDNPYLASLSLSPSDSFLEQRLRALPGVTFRRMGDLLDFEWEHPNLLAWSEAAP
jgi:hypothetical protein